MIDETPKDVEITNNQFVKVVFENNPMSGLLIRKVEDGTLVPLEGAEFTVKTKAGLLIGNYRSGADGTVLVPELESGWYTVTETKVPDGYSLGDNVQTVEITHSKLVVIEFQNKPFGSIVIKKIDEITSAPLAGAYFTVKHQNGVIVGEYTTGSDGTVSISNVDTGWYVISETKAPAGYTLDSTAKTVEVKPSVPTVATFTNKLHSGIEIIKLDAITNVSGVSTPTESVTDAILPGESPPDSISSVAGAAGAISSMSPSNVKPRSVNDVSKDRTSAASVSSPKVSVPTLSIM